MPARRALPSLVACLIVFLPCAAPGAPPAPKGGPVHTDRYGDLLPDGAIARLGTVRLWHHDADQLAFSGDGKMLVSGGPRSIRLWAVPNGQLLHRWDEGGPLALAPDGKTLATASGH